MYTALDPENHEEITAEAFRKKYGRPTPDANDDFQMPDAICRVCSGPVYFMAALAQRRAHFRHYEGARCPSQTETGRPYLALRPANPDPDAGHRLRLRFRENWVQHYFAVDALVPCLSFKEFLHLLEMSLQEGMWDYRDFPESMVPYSLVLAADFPPWTGRMRNGVPERRLWFRFWYDHRLRTLNDLWIRPLNQSTLFRGSYTPPRTKTGRPHPDLDFVARKPVEIDPNFLDRPVNQLPAFVVDEVERWFQGRREFA